MKIISCFNTGHRNEIIQQVSFAGITFNSRIRMKKIIIAVVAFLVAAPAIFAQTKAGKIDTTKHTSFYVCPRHSQITSPTPGKCPICGMELTLSGKEQMKASITKNYSCPQHVEITSHDPGKCPKCGRKLERSPKEQMTAQAVKLYTCPMHPDVALDKDGVCPKCGSTLVEKKAKQ